MSFRVSMKSSREIPYSSMVAMVASRPSAAGCPASTAAAIGACRADRSDGMYAMRTSLAPPEMRKFMCMASSEMSRLFLVRVEFLPSHDGNLGYMPRNPFVWWPTLHVRRPCSGSRPQFMSARTDLLTRSMSDTASAASARLSTLLGSLLEAHAVT